MGKYDGLRDYLRRQNAPSLKLSLNDIDNIVQLPQSAFTRPAWWANEDLSHVQSNAWYAAGYDAAVDVNKRTVIFTRRT